MRTLATCVLAAATAAIAAAAYVVPSLPLGNAAVPGLTMPYTGLGTGGYAQACGAVTTYPECWDADVNATVATWVANATADYLRMATAGGVPVARLDNANSYQNMAAVGAGMRASGVPRERIWLLSKIGNGLAMGYADTHAQFSAICSTQGVTYVDALLIHWPTATAHSQEPACNAGDAAYNATACRLDTWRALVEIFNAGGARSIGVSNYYVEHLEEIRVAGMPLPALNQIPYHIYRSSSWAETQDYCLRHGIAINSYSPLGVPDWHKFPTAGTGMSVTQLQDPVVLAIAQAHGRSPAAVLLNWLGQLGIPSNPRTYSRAHMDEDLSAYDFALNSTEVDLLSSRPQAWCSVDNYYECAPSTASASAPASASAKPAPAPGAAATVLLPRGAARETASCGNLTKPLDPTRKNVLLVGDSISMTPPYTPGGYGGALEALLAKQGIAVQHAGGDFSGGQAGDSEMGTLCTDPGYAGGYFAGLPAGARFDLIHFNYGLHDLANYGPTLPPTPLPQYGANLVTVYQRFAARAKAVMWTSTTPCPNVTTSYDRSYDKVVAYNARAIEVLKPLAPVWLEDDLWSDFIAQCGDHYKACSLQLPANVHLSPAGITFAAEAAAKRILAVLQQL